MKHCINCNELTKEDDIYCRNCGVKIKGMGYHIWLNIVSTFMIIGIIFVIILFGMALIIK